LDSPTVDIQGELGRRHKAASRTVLGLMLGTVLIAVLAYVGHERFWEQNNPPLQVGVMITVLFLGIGSIVWRRNKFSAMRLQDIGALQGPSGLLRTLEKTTLQLALIGAAVAVIGFIATVLTGDDGFTYRAGAIAMVVFLYSYPTKSSWQRVIRSFSESQ
jgi:hypothetical protein